MTTSKGSPLPTAAREVLGRREHERLVRLGVAACDVDHRRLRLEADHVTIGHERSHLRSEVAGAAPDVEHPVARTKGERREELVVVASMVAGVRGIVRTVPRDERVHIVGLCPAIRTP